MYGKVFDTIYDGTLADDWRALVTFQQLIVLCDADGVVDMTVQALSRRTGIPIEHLQAGIEALEQPDINSRSSEEEGRRIVRIDAHKDWGWYLVNHKKYSNLRDAREVREANRVRKQRQRDKQADVTPMSRDVTPCHAKSQHIDIDIDIDKTKQKKKTPALSDNRIADAIGLGVNEELWLEFLANRKRLKASNSPAAMTTLVNKLTNLQQRGFDPQTLVETANERGWKTIYEPDEKRNEPTAREIATNTNW